MCASCISQLHAVACHSCHGMHCPILRALAVNSPAEIAVANHSLIYKLHASSSSFVSRMTLAWLQARDTLISFIFHGVNISGSTLESLELRTVC